VALAEAVLRRPPRERTDMTPIRAVVRTGVHVGLVAQGLHSLLKAHHGAGEGFSTSFPSGSGSGRRNKWRRGSRRFAHSHTTSEPITTIAKPRARPFHPSTPDRFQARLPINRDTRFPNMRTRDAAPFGSRLLTSGLRRHRCTCHHISAPKTTGSPTPTPNAKVISPASRFFDAKARTSSGSINKATSPAHTVSKMTLKRMVRGKGGVPMLPLSCRPEVNARTSHGPNLDPSNLPLTQDAALVPFEWLGKLNQRENEFEDQAEQRSHLELGSRLGGLNSLRRSVPITATWWKPRESEFGLDDRLSTQSVQMSAAIRSNTR
jgi:hypothetical protein